MILTPMRGIITAQPSDLKRFWSKVNKANSNSCWIWTSAKRGGRAAFWFEGQTVSAARFVKNILDNPGVFALHTCDNTMCVREDHIFLGTQADNMRDCADKKRRRKYNLHLRTLTDDEIRFIRTAVGTQREIADKVGCTQSTVGKIRLGRIYCDVA